MDKRIRQFDSVNNWTSRMQSYLPFFFFIKKIFFERDFIFKKTSFEKPQHLKQEQRERKRKQPRGAIRLRLRAASALLWCRHCTRPFTTL